MPHTTCSIRFLRRELDLRVGPDVEASLREFDRRETAAVLEHLLGEVVRDERRDQAGW